MQSIEIIANFAREGPKKRESKEDKKFNEDTNAENNGIVKEDSKKSESKEIDFKVNEENKKGKRTIQRRIQKLKKDGIIAALTEKQLKKYGIKITDGQKKDGRAKYLVLKETIERDGELDKIIDSHIKGDDLDKKMILREINRCKRYILLPNQLDALASKLDTEDAELVEGFLRILHEYITKKEIKPQNKEDLVEKLKKVLERYPEGHKKHTMIRTYAIRLLGDYDDNAVIEQLIKDCEVGNLSEFKNDYFDWTTAKVIKKSKIKLFNLENSLRREGDTETADILADLRDWAEEVPETQKEMDELFKSGPCETGEKPNMGGLKKYWDKK
ncbi:Protein export cytoplasm protein SecA ATPase RNA helicase [Methanosarcina horonobensis HB-1 = JCM 15518]|uniref:Protein export cytoplasm protein SecA ATPase RNA helicase n=1 Tax=Methanosarcina horonobensis HB-1 = JCM 15518 TaxID=1434110 RepID=A0A0E3SEV5_9EURY|nr:Protein export cytoplasm protein SecA ATPase RNA helicase [Methanosarcina horonobensis HB-1 = JCM 15518]